MDIWSAVDMASTLVLAVLGSYLAIKPLKDPSTRRVAAWLAVFLLAAVGAIAAKYKQDDALTTKITGGDNYCFIQIGGLTRNGQPILQLSNITGVVPFMTYGFHKIENGQKVYILGPLNGWSSTQPCLKTTSWLPGSLPEGQYEIDFNGSNGVWEQTLSLKKQGDKMLVTSKITRDDGRKIVAAESTYVVTTQPN